MPRKECPLQSALREMLRGELSDGASPHHLSKILGKDVSNVRGTLMAMPDAYIDRWEYIEERRKYRPVYCLADIPQDCPHPEGE